MSREYEERFENSSARRSRRNPRARDRQTRAAGRTPGELNVMGDASVHPVRNGGPVRQTQVDRSSPDPVRRGRQENSGRTVRRYQGETGAAGTVRRYQGETNSGGSSRYQVNANNRGGSRRISAAQTAASSTAGLGNSGLTVRQEKDLARRRKRRRIITMIVAECFALVMIFGYGYFLRKWNTIQRPDFSEEEVKNNDISQETVEKMKGYWTIAVFGVDSRNNAIAQGTNADVNMICNINLDTGEIKLVSVFRDTYLNISTDGSYNKLNQAYCSGGPKQAVAALNRNLDLNITDYVTFNWKAVADAINILGGVDIELSDAEYYYINSFITETAEATGLYSKQLKGPGMQHLDGVQAVAYGRLRLMDTDFARTERQRKVIRQAFEKAKQADFDTLNRVLGTVFPQIATSMNVNDIFTSLKMINRYQLGDTTGFPQARGDANMGKKGLVVAPQTLESNVVKLHEFLYGVENYTPSEKVKEISSKIAADTGMFREGKYVDHVGTDGGVIQKPKATKAAKSTESEEETESRKSTEDTEKYATIYVLDKNGKKVKKSVPMETDEDGEYIKPRTNDDGLAIGWSLDEDGELVERETDEYGDEVTATRPEGFPTEEEPGGNDGPYRPGMTTPGETDAYGRPLPTESSGHNDRPGNRPGSTLPGNPGESSVRPTAPGETTPDSPHPDAIDAGASQRPGESGTSPTSPAMGGGPGAVNNQESGAASQSPQSPLSPGPAAGPGQDAQAGVSIVPSSGGPVSGPGASS